MDYSTPGLPVHYQLPESTQTHVHQVGDATQSSHPLSSPSPPALNLSQHQGLFQWVSSSHQVAKVLEFQLQHHCSNEHPGLIFRTDCLDLLAVQGTLKSLLHHHSSKVISQNGHHQKVYKQQMLERVWREGNALACWWEYRLIQSLWKTAWIFLKKLGIKPLYDSAIWLLSRYLEETKLKKTQVTHCSLQHYLQ